MNVQSFIENVFTEIFSGIKEAQIYANEIGGAINPKGLNYLEGSSGAVQHKETTRIGQEIEFDIAVVAQEEKGKEGVFGLSIPYLTTKGRASSSSTDETINRVRFKIPVIFPKSSYEE